MKGSTYLVIFLPLSSTGKRFANWSSNCVLPPAHLRNGLAAGTSLVCFAMCRRTPMKNFLSTICSFWHYIILNWTNSEVKLNCDSTTKFYRRGRIFPILATKRQVIIWHYLDLAFKQGFLSILATSSPCCRLSASQRGLLRHFSKPDLHRIQANRAKYETFKNNKLVISWMRHIQGTVYFW